MNLFFEIHKDLPREGPGSNEATAKAFSMLKELPANPYILDVGCGPGMQTIELARLTSGSIIALDRHQPFIDHLTEYLRSEGLQEHVKTIVGDMFSMPFADESFDLLWAEGSIFIIGFAQGLAEWKKFVKPGGYVAVTDVSWLNETPSEAAYAFWNEAYPAIGTIRQNQQTIREAGYREVGHFVLPPSAWWDDYFNPMEQRVKMLRTRYAGNAEAQAVLEMTQREIDLYREDPHSYSYVFYLMQKPR